MKKLMAVVLALLLAGGVDAQSKSGSGGSKGSSSSSSSSSGSRGSSQPPSKSGSSSSGSSKYSSGSSGSKSGSGSTASQPPKSGSSSSKSGESKASGSNSKSGDSKVGDTKSGESKYSSGSSSSKSGSTASTGNSTSKKPETNKNDDKALANRKDASKRTYEVQAQASAPPKSTYTTKDGKEVKIDHNDKVVAEIRNKPSTYFEPETRRQRIDVHVTNYHYGHPYNWYYSQPYYHVGGGYSSAFWWMMMEWDAERRAMWFYNNRYLIDNNAYQRGLQDAEVARRIAALEAQNAARQPRYVDPEFKDNPLDMYDDSYVEAVYNPTVKQHVAHTSEPSDWSGFWYTVLMLTGIGAVVYFLFFFKWGN